MSSMDRMATTTIIDFTPHWREGGIIEDALELPAEVVSGITTSMAAQHLKRLTDENIDLHVEVARLTAALRHAEAMLDTAVQEHYRVTGERDRIVALLAEAHFRGPDGRLMPKGHCP